MTNDGVMIIFDDRTIAVTKEMKYFKETMQRLTDHQTDNLMEVITPATRIEKHTGFTIKGEVVYVNNQPTPPRLSEVVIKFVDQKLPVQPIINFWKNLRNNPSPAAAKEELFDFLQDNSIALTEDGCFLAYKKVRADYTDCWTGKISNKVGLHVKMRREDVCADRNTTCAPGLHVASWAYFGECYSQDSDYHTLELKVNPRDVVSVPNEYKFAKMRTCGYFVNREILDNKPNNVTLKKKTRPEKPVKKEPAKPFKKESAKPFKKEPAKPFKKEPVKPLKKKAPVAQLVTDGTTIKVGNRGRIFIHKVFFEAIKAQANTTVYVTIDKNELSISTRPSKEAVPYLVTSNQNLKIGANILREAGFGKRTQVTVSVIGKEIVIE